MTVFAFDVDETLEVSGGPVTLGAVIELSRAGHIVGPCGNWAVVTQRVVGWHKLFSFLNAGVVPKETFLRDLRMWIPADDLSWWAISWGSPDRQTTKGRPTARAGAFSPKPSSPPASGSGGGSRRWPAVNRSSSRIVLGSPR